MIYLAEKELKEIATILLDTNAQHFELLDAAKALAAFFSKLSAIDVSMSHIDAQENGKNTHLQSGIAISPLDAAICTREYMRTSKYLRGVFAAINELLEKFTEETLHIFYAGTGPYATLILPLLPFFDPKKIQVSFLDIHQSSLDSLKNIIESLQLTPYLKEYICADATVYQPHSKVHMIITETMRAAFEGETQVNITLNLLPSLCEEGIFIPECVTVHLESAAYRTVEQEGVLHKEKESSFLANIIQVDTKEKRTFTKEDLILTPSLEIKENLKDAHTLYFFTTIKVYKEHILTEGECSLNLPQKLYLKERVLAGDLLTFSYNFDEKPEILYTHKINQCKYIPSDLQIRELLNQKNGVSLEKNTLSHYTNDLTSHILSTKKSLETYESTKKQLQTLYESLKGIFDFAQVPIELRERQFLNKTGFAMSPKNAITTLNDVFRVSGFIRAIDQAIKDLKQVLPCQTLHIVYPACGPLAPLLLPLLNYYKTNKLYTAKELQITFIDIQEGAVIALSRLLQVLELDLYIKDLLCIDAVNYQKNSEIHLIILEAMQHGFSKEGHLSIAKHFAPLLHEKGIFLPENIKIKAVLALGEEEYNTQFKESSFSSSFTMQQDSKNKRIELGNILEINLQSVKNMKLLEFSSNTRLVECATHTIPFIETNEKDYILLFTTSIQVYKDEEINEYDSGITHPLPDFNIYINTPAKSNKQESDLYLQSGEKITFYYKLVGLPGFLAIKGGPYAL